MHYILYIIRSVLTVYPVLFMQIYIKYLSNYIYSLYASFFMHIFCAYSQLTMNIIRSIIQS